MNQAANHTEAQKKLQEIINNSLPTSLDAHSEKGARLMNFLPRNEMELATHIVYELANTDAATLANDVSSLPHESKHAIFSAFIDDSSDKQVLRHVTYSWDIVADYKTFRRLLRVVPLGCVMKQAFSPRYGYDVPKAIEDAGLSDTFEQAFDLSLELYSLMQAAGFETEAQYAVLTGHRLRFKVTLNAYEFMKVLTDKSQKSFDVERLLKDMHAQVAAVHPLIAGLVHKV